MRFREAARAIAAAGKAELAVCCRLVEESSWTDTDAPSRVFGCACSVQEEA